MPNALVSRFNLRCSNVVHLFPNRHVIPLYVFRLHTSCFYWMWLLLSCCCRKDVVWRSSIKRKAQCADEGKRNKCIINNGHTPKHTYMLYGDNTSDISGLTRVEKMAHTHTNAQQHTEFVRLNFVQRKSFVYVEHANRMESRGDQVKATNVDDKRRGEKERWRDRET